MKRTLIKNGYIITKDSEDARFFGDLLVEGEKIIDLAPSLDKLDPVDEIIDAKGKLVIPGFVQGHVHLCQTLFRGLSQDRALIEWLQVILPLEVQHTDDSVYASSRLAIAEMLKSGTTCFNTMGTYDYFLAEAQAIVDMGIKARTGRTIMDAPWDDKKLAHATDKGLQEAEAFLSTWPMKYPGRIYGGIPIRWILMTTEASFQGVKELAHRFAVPIHNHANENQVENEMVENKFGMTAIEKFLDIGWLDEKNQLAHCVWLTENEKRILVENDGRVIHCPSCNHKAASGLAPIPEYLDRDIVVGLGTDTGACSDNLDMFREMRLAAFAQKLNHGPEIITAEQVFEMATLGGARALYLDHEIGSLEKGKKADLLILGIPLEAHPFHYDEAVSAIVYSMNSRDVELTMVNGEVLVRDQHLTEGSEEDIIIQAEKALKRMMN